MQVRILRALILAAIAFASYRWMNNQFSPEQTVVVVDASKPQKIVLQGSKSLLGSSLLSVTVSGRIDGRATIGIEGMDWTVQDCSGDIRYGTGFDSCGEAYVLEFNPRGVKSGSIIVTYQYR